MQQVLRFTKLVGLAGALLFAAGCGRAEQPVSETSERRDASNWLFVPGIWNTTAPGVIGPSSPNRRVLRTLGKNTKVLNYNWRASAGNVRAEARQKFLRLNRKARVTKLFCHSMGTFVCATLLNDPAIASQIDTVVMYAPVFGATRSRPPRGVDSSIGTAKMSQPIMSTLRRLDGRISYVVAERDRIFSDAKAGVPSFARHSFSVRANHLAAATNPRVVRAVVNQVQSR